MVTRLSLHVSRGKHFSFCRAVNKRLDERNNYRCDHNRATEKRRRKREYRPLCLDGVTRREVNTPCVREVERV